MNDFLPLFKFEREVASYFGAPYGVATDSCTHALELCLKLKNYPLVQVPLYSYVSVPFMLIKIGQKFKFKKDNWKGYYYLTSDIIDAAAFWKKGGYVKGSKMCLSFHSKKHLNLGKGGMILLDNKKDKERLERMRYDGRSIYQGVLYSEDHISTLGYHYYMTPEEATRGLDIFKVVKNKKPKEVGYSEYPDLTKLPFFKKYLKKRLSLIE